MNNLSYKVMALGALAGMRSMAAPMLLSHQMSQDRTKPLHNTPLRLLGNDMVALALKVLAAGELVGDKMPGVPDRIDAPSLAFRGASGALVGAALYMADKQKPLEGAALGAAAAVAATFGSFYIRKYLSEHTAVADPVIGALEDALVLGSGLQVSRM